MLLIMLICSMTSSVICHMNFTGHRLYSLTANDEKKLSYLEKLVEEDEVDVWNDPLKINRHINVHIPPHLVRQLEQEWRTEGIQFSLISSDLQKRIDTERENNDDEMQWRDPGSIAVDQYHSFEVINAYLDELGKTLPKIVKVIIIGKTFEGNPIKGVKIGTAGKNKPALWIDAGIHAREWISTSTAIYIIRELLGWYDIDPKIKDLVDTFDWYIFPVINVDGYKYTLTHNRLWRKNRAELQFKEGRSVCKGADPNRNFDTEVVGPTRSGKSCSEIYRGQYTFSEAESRAIRDGVLGLGGRLKAYFSLHSYSQVWLTPFGKSKERTPDHEDQMIALKAAVNATSKMFGEEYDFGTIANTLYPAKGTSVDWTYEKAHIKYSFVIELRDTGQEGFILDNSLILPTAAENFAGIKAVVNIVRNEFGLWG